MQHKRINFTFEIFLLSANLRVAITALPPLTNKIQSFFQLDSAQMGAVTTIPLLCFGFLSIFAGQLIKRMGTTFTLRLALVMLAVANLLRVYVSWGLFVGTVFVGAAITLLNVTLPTMIVEWHPEKSSFLNGVYTASINLFSALVGGIIVPLANHFSWQIAIQMFSIPAIIAFIGSLFLGRAQGPAASEQATVAASRNTAYPAAWRRRHVWLLAIFMGLQSFVFYTLVAWLPSVMMSHHSSATKAGWLVALFQIIGMPFSYFVPRAAHSRARLFKVNLAFAVGYVVGIGLMFTTSSATPILVMISLLLGITTAATFSLSLSLITEISIDGADASSVGGLVQSVGYLLAASGPTIFGATRQLSHSWTVPLIVLLVVAIVTIIFGQIFIQSSQKVISK
ncbi:MFS transporter [Agrilactobacillus fermenti]|uniref:MFS transporter n=1 Tax=Agrilactobacillus fermenti TaxID=2586909 RepID=UPI003A5C0087